MKRKYLFQIRYIFIAVTFFYACNTPPRSCLDDISVYANIQDIEFGKPLEVPRDLHHACLLSIFSGTKLNTPADFDTSYSAISQFYESTEKISYDEILRAATMDRGTYCTRLGNIQTIQVFLLQEITGQVMEGEEYDILFTLDASGKVIDHLLIGASDVLYKRSFRIIDTDHFSINEVTGREEEMGPIYHASYRISNAGKIVVEKSTITLAESTESDDAEYGESLIYLDSNKNSSKAFTELAFVDDMVPDTAFSQLLFGQEAIIAFHISEDRDQTLYMAWPTEQKTDKQAYRLATLRLAGPQASDLLSQRLFVTTLKKMGDHYLITFRVEEQWLAAGGDPDSGEPSLQKRLRDIQFQVTKNGTLKAIK